MSTQRFEGQMTLPRVTAPADMGRLLAAVRLEAEVKQGELAARLGLSPAVLSRMESGERPPSLEEAVAFLREITSPRAQSLLRALERSWSVLPVPALDHPDQELLWAAELVGRKLEELKERPDLSHAFVVRVERYLAELRSAADLLLKREHQVAFVGPVGVGKSTAICHATGLVVHRDGGRSHPVLADGGGGTTLCEVHIRGGGPEYGIVIEPRTGEEIHDDVRDFVDFLLRDATGKDDERRADAQAISRELSRAIRNMAGLPAPSTKDKRDAAKELALMAGGSRAAVVEILSRMAPHTRDRRQLWYDATVAKSPFEWLREEFRRINHGQNPEFTIPKRIELVVKERLVEVPGFSLRLVDTKGIDSSAAREDLEGYLDDPHSLTVICSRFNDAPGTAAHQLIERAVEGGNREMSLRSCVLVLAHADEPFAMTDDATGEPVAQSVEGYELKRAHAEMNMAPLGLRDYPIRFYDCFTDAPEVATSFIGNQLSSARQSFAEKLRVAMDGAQELVRNYGEAEVQAVLDEATSRLADWLRVEGAAPELRGNVHDTLLGQIAVVHPASIYAAVRRSGEWQAFSYSYQVGHGARRMAVAALGKKVDSFEAYCKVLAASPDLALAKELIEQSSRAMVTAFDELQQKVQLLGRTASADAFKGAQELWQRSEGEWGSARGFRQAIGAFTREWFAGEQPQRLEAEIREAVKREWRKAVEELGRLLNARGIHEPPLR